MRPCHLSPPAAREELRHPHRIRATSTASDSSPPASTIALARTLAVGSRALSRRGKPSLDTPPREDIPPRQARIDLPRARPYPHKASGSWAGRPPPEEPKREELTLHYPHRLHHLGLPPEEPKREERAEDEGGEQISGLVVHRQVVLGVELSDQVLIGKLTVSKDLRACQGSVGPGVQVMGKSIRIQTCKSGQTIGLG